MAKIVEDRDSNKERIKSLEGKVNELTVLLSSAEAARDSAAQDLVSESNQYLANTARTEELTEAQSRSDAELARVYSERDHVAVAAVWLP